MKVLFLSHTFYGSTFLVGSHQLAREMVGLGVETWHISTPIRKRTIFKLNGERKRRLELSGQIHKVDEIHTYVPQILSFPHIYRLDQDKVLINYGLPKFDLIVIDQPSFFISAIALKRQTGARIIFRPTDVFTRLDLVLLAGWLRKYANFIIVTSKKCFSERFYKKNKKPIFVKPNGLDSRSISLLKDELIFPGINKKKISAVYIGAIDSRIDWEFLKKLYSTGVFKTIDLFGPSKLSVLKSQGISLCGAVNHEDLNIVLKAYDCALLPFSNTRRNSSRSPMKISEYLLNGIKIISTEHFVLPAEMKPFENAVLFFEKNMNRGDLDEFMSKEVTCFITEDLKTSLSFRATAMLILELGSAQT